EDGIRDRNVTGVQTCALPITNNRFIYRHVSTTTILFSSRINKYVAFFIAYDTNHRLFRFHFLCHNTFSLRCFFLFPHRIILLVYYKSSKKSSSSSSFTSSESKKVSSSRNNPPSRATVSLLISIFHPVNFAANRAF